MFSNYFSIIFPFRTPWKTSKILRVLILSREFPRNSFQFITKLLFRITETPFEIFYCLNYVWYVIYFFQLSPKNIYPLRWAVILSYNCLMNVSYSLILDVHEPILPSSCLLICHPYAEAVSRGVLLKTVHKNFTISTEKHLCWSLFLIKLQALVPATLLKIDSNTGFFTWILQNFEEHPFWRASANGCFCLSSVS